MYVTFVSNKRYICIHFGQKTEISKLSFQPHFPGIIFDQEITKGVLRSFRDTKNIDFCWAFFPFLRAI